MKLSLKIGDPVRVSWLRVARGWTEPGNVILRSMPPILVKEGTVGIVIDVEEHINPIYGRQSFPLVKVLWATEQVGWFDTGDAVYHVDELSHENPFQVNEDTDENKKEEKL